MAIQIPIITSLEDSGIKAAKAAFNNFKLAVREAEGGMNKFKAGGNAALQSVKDNAGAFALAAGSALVTFAAKGVAAFQELAIESGKFADATGLTVEEASRLIEVTGDLGIETKDVETAVGKMNKELGKSPELFKELGIQVAYARDGSVDANETFLNTIDRLNKIKDPAERAKVATQVLGRSWQNMAELIAGGSERLRESLYGVSDAKVISKRELENARRFRAAMDDLKDVVEDIALVIGEKLVPYLADASKEIKDAAPEIELTTASLDYLGKKMIGTPTEQFKANMNMAKSALALFGVEAGKKETQEDLVNLGGYASAAADSFEKMNQQTLNAIKYAKLQPLKPITTQANSLATELKNVKTAWDEIVARFDEKVAFDQAVEKLAEVEAAAAQAFATGADSDIAKYNVAAADMIGLLAIISEGLGALASREIKLRFTTEGFPAALALAQYYQGGAEFRGLDPMQALTQAGIPTLSAGSSSGAGTIGGSTVNVTVTSADPNQVVAAIQEWSRNNGSVPINTTSSIRR